MAWTPRVRTLLRILEEEGLLWLADEVRHLAERPEPDLTEDAVAQLRRESDDGTSPRPRQWSVAGNDTSAALVRRPDFDACLDHVTQRVNELSCYLESIQEMASELGISRIQLGHDVENGSRVQELVPRLRGLAELIQEYSPK